MPTGIATTIRSSSMREGFLKDGAASRDDITALDRKVDAQMAEARKFAVDSPLPPPETALQHVFA